MRLRKKRWREEELNEAGTGRFKEGMLEEGMVAVSKGKRRTEEEKHTDERETEKKVEQKT